MLESVVISVAPLTRYSTQSSRSLHFCAFIATCSVYLHQVITTYLFTRICPKKSHRNNDNNKQSNTINWERRSLRMRCAANTTMTCLSIPWCYSSENTTRSGWPCQTNSQIALDFRQSISGSLGKVGMARWVTTQSLLPLDSYPPVRSTYPDTMTSVPVKPENIDNKMHVFFLSNMNVS